MAKSNGGKDVSLVKCRVEPGMFKDEWLVFLDAVDPQSRAKIPIQLFADSREITNLEGTPKRNNPVSAWLRVSLVKDHRLDYNHQRPHSALGYQTPAEFAAACRKCCCATLRSTCDKPQEESLLSVLP